MDCLAEIRRLTAEIEVFRAHVADSEGEPAVDDSPVESESDTDDQDVGGLKARLADSVAQTKLLSRRIRRMASEMAKMSAANRRIMAECEQLQERVAQLEAADVVVPVAPELGPEVEASATDDSAKRVEITAAGADLDGGGTQMTSLGFLQRRMGLSDFEHDGARRSAMVDEMLMGGQPRSEAEARLLGQATDLLRLSIDDDTRKTRALEHGKTIEVARMIRDTTMNRWVGEIRAVVPTSPQQAVAFLMHVNSKFNASNPEFDVACKILEVPNPHHLVVFCEASNKPHVNRTFLNSLLFEKIADTPLTYVWAAVPIDGHQGLTRDREVARRRRRCERG